MGQLTRDEALTILKRYNKDPFHIRHALTVEAVLQWFANELGYGDETHRVRGRNTENSIVELDCKMANYQGKRYVLMNFFHIERHIVFSNVGKGRRKMEVYDGVEVNITIAK